MKILIGYIFITIYSYNLIASDSLKVYIVGTFIKGESFKFHTPKKTYIINNKNDRFAAWYFYLPIDSTFKEGSLLPIVIEKKTRRKYYNVELMCFFQPDRRYFIIWKDKRQSSKYPFIELWTNKPQGSITISPQFWENGTDSRFFPQTIDEIKYNYFFNNLGKFYKTQN